MAVLSMILLISLILIVFMMKQAFENHVLQHEIHLYGENELVSLFFISDIHNRKINDRMVHNIDKPINAVIIGGDLADKRTSKHLILHNIYLLQSLAPVYFVWGNNDREVGEEFLRSIFEETGVTIIENDAILLKNSNNPCWFSAVDDQSKEVQKALKKCRDKDVIVFIAHNPEVFPSLKNVPVQVDLMLAGHYHGGQIRFGKFGIYPLGSFSTVDGVPTLISNGYGTTLVPFRFGAKPECHIIDLHFQK